jgi:hypothetical protein
MCPRCHPACRCGQSPTPFRGGAPERLEGARGGGLAGPRTQNPKRPTVGPTALL